MIITFKNKELRIFFLSGKKSKIPWAHVKKIRFILAKLNTATKIIDMNFPGSDLHQLKGKLQGLWSVSVNGNWRIVFRLENENVYEVDYLDYH